MYNADHLRTLGEGRCDRKKDREATNKTKIKGLVRNLKGTNKCLILRAKSTGACLSVHGTTVSGKVLSDTEHFLCARYNVSPLNLQRHCEECGTAFGLTYALSCSTGGQVIMCHNEISDELIYLLRHAFTSACVRAKPLIHQGRTRSEQEIHHGSDKKK